MEWQRLDSDLEELPVFWSIVQQPVPEDRINPEYGERGLSPDIISIKSVTDIHTVGHGVQVRNI